MKIIKPVRATRTCTQHLAAGPEAVFPRLCPVRESDWIEGRDPRLVVTGRALPGGPGDFDPPLAGDA